MFNDEQGGDRTLFTPLSLPLIHHLSLFRSFPSFLALFSDRD